MQNSTLKKTTLVALVASLLVLPACGWRKKKRVIYKPVNVIKKQETVEMPHHYSTKNLAFDDTTQQLIQEDEPLFVAHDTQHMDEDFNFDESAINLEDVNNQEESVLVYFDYAKENPSADQKDNLALATQKAQELVAQGKKVVVKAHACEFGENSRVRNLPLSQERAEKLAQHIAKKAGIDPENITAFGVGSEEPVTLEQTLEAQNCNRRAEIYGLSA